MGQTLVYARCKFITDQNIAFWP